MVGTAFTPDPQNQPAGVVGLAALSGLTLAIHNANIYSLCEGGCGRVTVKCDKNAKQISKSNN